MRELADTLLQRYKIFQQEAARNQAKPKQTATAARRTNEEKPRPSGVSVGVRKEGGNLSAGVKRPIEDVTRGSSALSGAVSKKAALGDGKNPNHDTNSSKTSVAQPARLGASSMAGEKKSLGAPSGINATSAPATSTAKKTPGFFKKLEGKAEPPKVHAKCVFSTRFTINLANHVISGTSTRSLCLWLPSRPLPSPVSLTS